MITKEDMSSLDAVFAYARQATVGDEKTLISIINFKQTLFKKLEASLSKTEEPPITEEITSKD